MFIVNEISQKTLFLSSKYKRYKSFSFQYLWNVANEQDLGRSLIQRKIEGYPDRVAAIRLSDKGNFRKASPLHIAVIAGDSRYVKQLITEWKADPIQKDKCGISPIDLAKAINEKEVVDAIDPNDQYKSNYETLAVNKAIIYDLNEPSHYSNCLKNSLIHLQQDYNPIPHP